MIFVPFSKKSPSTFNHELNENILILELEAEGKPCLRAKHSILNAEAARIVVEECQPFLPRYQVANELLVEGESL